MAQLQLTMSDNGKTIDLTPGTLLAIELMENPSTGYLWAIDPIEPPVLELLSNEYTLDPNVGFPGGGTRRLDLRAIRSGEVRLSLRLAQPWDPSAIAQRFVLILRVR